MDQDGIDLFFTVGKDITREEDLLPLFSHAPDPLLSDGPVEKKCAECLYSPEYLAPRKASCTCITIDQNKHDSIITMIFRSS